ncbi:hypothetical protein QMK33_05965 [Hymenobacter sp. H14-R3]|uniref:hypothetical protein n=1 Tax=Hymenobacter sp. H14-R3 TaxID=3046308 RepID=UPI0024B89CA1|nr:hypothetical protein [Hymenobacter sp. H14-R3]MDJ0364692.1 hypothetical protein [Hymenobacter sp. H14-R3]
MFIPRRVRRRLLLPPGWVALGFLLLLGCQALRQWQAQLKQWRFIPITVPARLINQLYTWNAIVYQPVSKLNTLRPWHDITFKGRELPDFFSAAATESAIRQVMADSGHAGGVRVRFWPGATYANLVKVLNIMNYTNQKKHWLDIRQQPLTLYAITDKLLPVKPALVADLKPINCATGYYQVENSGIGVGFQKIVSGLWQKSRPLWRQVWLLPVALLFLLGVLNSVHLLRLRTGCRNSLFTPRKP